MVIRSIRCLEGPNVFIYRPVLVMELDLEELAGRETREFNAFNERLLALLPGLREHGCAKGTAGAFVERLEGGTYFGHVIEHVALELSERAGAGVTYGKTIGSDDPRVYQLIVEYSSAAVMRLLLKTAVELVDTLRRGHDYAVLPARVEEAERLLARTSLGPSTQAIVDAAKRRGIPISRLGEGSLVQLGYGKRRRLLEATVASSTSAVAVDIAGDKQLTREMLRRAFLPVPLGDVAHTGDDALRLLADIGAPVAVKPRDGNQGRGITLDVRTPEQMTRAFAVASAISAEVVVEEMLEGRDYRVIVVGGRFVAASERAPAEVVGDGTHTVEQLVEEANRDPRRGDGHEKPLTRIRLDRAADEILATQGLDVKAVPPVGMRVRLRGAANLSTGGTARDVTAIVHPDIVATCERAARVIGLDICGIDLVVEDITRPLPRRGSGIVEINAGPGIRMHHHPSEGESRDVGGAIIDMLFHHGDNGRIPLVSITGTNGKTTVARMLAWTAAKAQLTAGLTTTDGVYIGGCQIAKGDMTGPRSARAVLADPAVEIAVLETARGGILRSGLGYDWSDVGVLTNVQLDHIGQDGIESIEDLVHIKSLVAERVREGGTLVLNADDEHVAALPEDRRVRRIRRTIVYFSLHPVGRRLDAHLAAGGTAYFPKNGWIVEARGTVLEPVCRIAAVPSTLGGAAQFNLSNALATVAAGRALGFSTRVVAEALESFEPERENPGRANLYAVGEGYVLLDYGHNPAAITAIGRMTGRWHGRRLTGIVGLPGDRTDAIVQQAAAAAAGVFDRIVVREDRDLRGRQRGQMAGIIEREIRRARPSCACEVIAGEDEALRHTLRTMEAGELVAIFYEDLASVMEVLLAAGATPVPGGLSAMWSETPTSALRQQWHAPERRAALRPYAHEGAR